MLLTSSVKSSVRPKRKKRKRIVLNCSKQKYKSPPKKTNHENLPNTKTCQVETSNAPVDPMPCYKLTSSFNKRESTTLSTLDSQLEESFDFIRNFCSSNNKVKRVQNYSSIENNSILGKVERKKVKLKSRLHNDGEPEDFILQEM